VTGGVGAGKSSFLQEVVQTLRERAVFPAGFLAEGIVEKGERKGYRLADLTSGERRPFGEVRERKGRIHTGRFTFNQETLRWGEDLLWQAVSREDTPLIILDEVGPLELKGKGWARAMEHLLHQSRIPQVWAVRSRAVEAVIKAWNLSPAAVVDVGKQTPAELTELLLSFIVDVSQRKDL
jgi:nucleoside-triphosphatase THEP1